MKSQGYIAMLKEYPFAIGCLVLMIVCAGVLYLRKDVVAELANREDEVKTRLRMIERNASNAQGLEEDVKALEDAIDTIADRLFHRDERASNTNFFYSLEERADINILQVNQLEDQAQAFAADGPRELKGYGAIPYQLTIQGKFSEIIRFLGALRNVEPYLRVSSLQLSSGGRQKAPDGMLSVQLRIAVLARKD